MTTTTDQALTALERANSVRLKQAALARELHGKPRPQGEAQLAEIIRDTDVDEYLRARVGYLVTSIRRRGPVSAGKLLRKLGIGESKRLGELTDRQRRLLAKAITMPTQEVSRQPVRFGFRELLQDEREELAA